MKRTVRFQEVVEITGCGGRAENQPSWQQFPRGRSGEKYLDPRGAGPGEQGSRPRVSVAVETLAKPDDVFSIRPGLARRKGSGRLPPKSLASIRQETARNQARIRQELETPGCIVSGAATSAALDRARCSGCQHSMEPGQRGTVGKRGTSSGVALPSTATAHPWLTPTLSPSPAATTPLPSPPPPESPGPATAKFPSPCALPLRHQPAHPRRPGTRRQPSARMNRTTPRHADSCRRQHRRRRISLSSTLAQARAPGRLHRRLRNPQPLAIQHTPASLQATRNQPPGPAPARTPPAILYPPIPRGTKCTFQLRSMHRGLRLHQRGNVPVQ